MQDDETVALSASASPKQILRGESFLSEAEVLAAWPMLTTVELRRARRRKVLTFYAFRDQTRYTEADVADYIGRTYKRAALVREGAEPTSNAVPKVELSDLIHSTADVTEDQQQFAAEVAVENIRRRKRGYPPAADAGKA